MQRVTVLCVGKLKEKFYIDAAAEYSKRLQRFCKLDIVELPYRSGCPRAARWWPCASRASPAPAWS